MVTNNKIFDIKSSDAKRDDVELNFDKEKIVLIFNKKYCLSNTPIIEIILIKYR